MHADVKVKGDILLSFLYACSELQLVLDLDGVEPAETIEKDQWYPFQMIMDLERAVTMKCQTTDGIMEKIGIVMSQRWYHQGPLKEIIKRGVEYLFFQSMSQGYRSVMKGPQSVIGDFTLIGFDEPKGLALIRSTTPFNKDLERGIIIGGMSAPGDLQKIKVDNREDQNRFFIEFQ